MAVYSPRHFGTLTISDGAGTPASLTVTLYSDVQIEPGYEDHVWIIDENLNISTSHAPLKGAEKPTMTSFKAKQTGLVGSGLTLGDIIMRTSNYTGLTSTIAGGTATRNEITLDVTLTITDGTNETSYAFGDSIIKGSFAGQDDGNIYNVTVEMPSGTPTITYS